MKKEDDETILHNTETQTGEILELSPPRDHLEILSGPEDGKRFEILRPTITIGRLIENDMCIPLELSISRHHAALTKKEDGYELEVLPEARNPATVGGELVSPGQNAILHIGDTFKLGNVLIELGV